MFLRIVTSIFIIRNRYISNSLVNEIFRCFSSFKTSLTTTSIENSTTTHLIIHSLYTSNKLTSAPTRTLPTLKDTYCSSYGCGSA